MTGALLVGALVVLVALLAALCRQWRRHESLQAQIEAAATELQHFQEACARLAHADVAQRPLTRGEVPVQSHAIWSPCFRMVTVSGMGTPKSIPSSSMWSVKLHSPSGSSRSAARVSRSV